MLKAVSSITNAIGALNYKGTWNANTNSPALASGVGTKGDYYVVSVAGTTTLDGISNWGIGDWAVFNGSAWQRVEGGADLNGVNLSVSGTTTLSGLTASTALALNAQKEVVSVTNTGSGSNVLATSPALVTPILGTPQSGDFSTGTFTWPTFNQNTTGSANSVKSNATTGLMQIAGPAAGQTRVVTIPDANATMARTDAAQTFTGTQTVSGGNLAASGSVIAATNRTILAAAVLYDDTINGNATGIGLGGASVFPTNGAGNGVNNTKSIGNASFRWSEVFAVNGTINTSDRNAKQDIAALDDAEKRVAQRIKGLVKKYRFKDAVALKGDDARIHVGFVAQEIEQAFADEGLDANRYGIFCRDVWYEVDGNALDENKKAYTKESAGAVEKTTVGLRYDQVFAFLVAVM